MTSDSVERPIAIWRLEQFQGENDVIVSPTQLVSNRGITPALQKTILSEWMTFFASGPSVIKHLKIGSRVTQPLLDSLAGQTQLESLALKWGPYADLAPLEKMGRLITLDLSGAKKVIDLAPLRQLNTLSELRLDEPNSVVDFSPLGELFGLRRLSLGNGYPGSAKSLELGRLDWLSNLNSLESLSLPGTKIASDSLSLLAALPNLSELRIPLRTEYRSQVVQLAENSAVFEVVARRFVDFERSQQQSKATKSD